MYQARDQEDEADYVVEKIKHLRDMQIPLSNIAILYRTNYQSRAIEESLLKEGVPYKLVGGFRFYERKEIKDIISYLRFVYNIKDELSLDRVLNVPTRKIGPKTVAILHESAKQIECSVGELLVAAYLKDHPEVDNLVGIRSDIIAKIDLIGDNLGKLQSLISTFGYIYTEAQNKNILDIIDMILEKTNYIKWFDDGSDQAEMKKENISELKNVAYTYVQKKFKQ